MLRILGGDTRRVPVAGLEIINAHSFIITHLRRLLNKSKVQAFFEDLTVVPFTRIIFA